MKIQIAGLQTPSLNYERFPFAELYSSKLLSVWSAVGAKWDAATAEKVGSEPALSLVEALSSHMTRHNWLAELLQRLYITDGALDEARCKRVWKKLRAPFRPPLSLWLDEPEEQAAMIKRVHSQTVCRALMDLFTRECISADLTTAGCYGPFSVQELQYVADHHPRIVEAGAGSGLIMAALARMGCEVVGFDSNQYGDSDGVLVPIWTAALRAERRLVIGGPEVFDPSWAERSLLISWPPPGGSFPYEVLVKYRESGGRALLLKLGYFIGGRSPGAGIPDPADPHGAVENFFNELSEHWLEDDAAAAALPYNPLTPDNCLWVFRRA